MKIWQIGTITGGQDGAIFGNELFRFDHRGNCTVHDLTELKEGEITSLTPVAQFALDRAEDIAPHCNTVAFGTEYFEASDEFPLLYCNIYNNYKNCEDDLRGTCCVYRLQRTPDGFSSTLVQLIRVGFVNDPMLWRAYEDRDGVRPFGNFVIDCDGGYCYAYVMRNEELGTRYFRFPLPSVKDGVIDPRFGVKCAVLRACDVLDSFDCEYHRYIQGGIMYRGKIYSSEGFTDNEKNRPAIRVIDTVEKRQEEYCDLLSIGYNKEPEMIDFYRGRCLYSDAHGSLYELSFEG